MSCMMFEHDVTYMWVGCADNVFSTRNGRGQGERLEAQARSRVYMADIARRNIGRARWDLETADGVLC